MRAIIAVLIILSFSYHIDGQKLIGKRGDKDNLSARFTQDHAIVFTTDLGDSKLNEFIGTLSNIYGITVEKIINTNASDQDKIIRHYDSLYLNNIYSPSSQLLVVFHKVMVEQGSRTLVGSAGMELESFLEALFNIPCRQIQLLIGDYVNPTVFTSAGMRSVAFEAIDKDLEVLRHPVVKSRNVLAAVNRSSSAGVMLSKFREALLELYPLPSESITFAREVSMYANKDGEYLWAAYEREKKPSSNFVFIADNANTKYNNQERIRELRLRTHYRNLRSRQSAIYNFDYSRQTWEADDDFTDCYIKKLTHSNNAPPNDSIAFAHARYVDTYERYEYFLEAYPIGNDRLLIERFQLETKKNTNFNKMEVIPGGIFLMGYPEAAQQYLAGISERKVQVPTFLLGNTEVTIREFSDFIQETNYQTTAEKKGGGYFHFSTELLQEPELNWRYDENGDPRTSFDSDYPVLYVSWLDAIHYCNWRSQQEGFDSVYNTSGKVVSCDWDANGYRLPTEAEWEYAAGGGNKDNRWGGTDHSGYVIDYANINDRYNLDIFKKLAPVGLFTPNEFGLYDTSGNVEEWCWDYYSDYPTDTTTIIVSPRGPTRREANKLVPMSVSVKVKTGDFQTEDKQLKFTGGGRVVKGGSWRSALHMSRVYARKRHYQLMPDNQIGFRIARNAK